MTFGYCDVNLQTVLDGSKNRLNALFAYHLQLPPNNPCLMIVDTVPATGIAILLFKIRYETAKNRYTDYQPGFAGS